MQFFLDSHLSNVTAEKFNRKESLRAQCPHHCFLFIQFNYHLLLTYSWPNFIFMYQRSEWPHPKSDSLPCLRFSLLVIFMHRSCPSLVGTTMKLTPKRQCSLLTTITTQTQSCVLQRTLPSPQQTRPCITSPVSCDTEGGGGEQLSQRACSTTTSPPIPAELHRWEGRSVFIHGRTLHANIHSCEDTGA